MAREIMISASPGEIRIAKFDGGRLTDIAFERERGANDVAEGDIVLAKVTRVEHSINMAFLDIGTERNAVLSGYDAEPLGDEQPEDDRGRRRRPRIDRLVTEGQTLVLKVVSEAMGSKGAKLTAKVTLPGQHLVFVSYRDEVVFSRQIEDQEEKDRLSEALEEVLPEHGGFIMRTSAVGLDADALRAEAKGLADDWAAIQARVKEMEGPGIIKKEEAGPIRALRDHLNGNIDHIIIDDGDLVATAKAYAKDHCPELLDAIEHYNEQIPLFEEYNIEAEIERLMSPRVPLKGGGWIIIEETEALTAIDVNSGRRRVQGGKEAMALDTNIAAVKEIAKQVRLRGLGGAFVIDCLQMREEKNMIKVEDALENAMKGDPMPHKVGEISDFGLLEMTRKRTTKPLSRVMSERCEPCRGRGEQLTAETLGLHVLRYALKEKPTETMTLSVAADVADYLAGAGAKYLEEVKGKLGVDVVVKVDDEIHRDRPQIDYPGRAELHAAEDDGDDTASEAGDENSGEEEE